MRFTAVIKRPPWKLDSLSNHETKPTSSFLYICSYTDLGVEFYIFSFADAAAAFKSSCVNSDPGFFFSDILPISNSFWIMISSPK